jgi:hypothetical protein
MSEKNDEKKIETAKNDEVVVVESAPRLQGGINVRSRIHAGKKASASPQG